MPLSGTKYLYNNYLEGIEHTRYIGTICTAQHHIDIPFGSISISYNL